MSSRAGLFSPVIDLELGVVTPASGSCYTTLVKVHARCWCILMLDKAHTVLTNIDDHAIVNLLRRCARRSVLYLGFADLLLFSRGVGSSRLLRLNRGHLLNR